MTPLKLGSRFALRRFGSSDASPRRRDRYRCRFVYHIIEALFEAGGWREEALTFQALSDSGDGGARCTVGHSVSFFTEEKSPRASGWAAIGRRGPGVRKIWRQALAWSSTAEGKSTERGWMDREKKVVWAQQSDA